MRSSWAAFAAHSSGAWDWLRVTRLGDEVQRLLILIVWFYDNFTFCLGAVDSRFGIYQSIFTINYIDGDVRWLLPRATCSRFNFTSIVIIIFHINILDLFTFFLSLLTKLLALTITSNVNVGIRYRLIRRHHVFLIRCLNRNQSRAALYLWASSCFLSMVVYCSFWWFRFSLFSFRMINIWRCSICRWFHFLLFELLVLFLVYFLAWHWLFLFISFVFYYQLSWTYDRSFFSMFRTWLGR